MDEAKERDGKELELYATAKEYFEKEYGEKGLNDLKAKLKSLKTRVERINYLRSIVEAMDAIA